MYCVNAVRECNGCGLCWEEMESPALYDCQGVPIYDGEAYYSVEGTIYSEETLQARKKMARRDEYAE